MPTIVELTIKFVRPYKETIYHKQKSADIISGKIRAPQTRDNTTTFEREYKINIFQVVRNLK